MESSTYYLFVRDITDRKGVVLVDGLLGILRISRDEAMFEKLRDPTAVYSHSTLFARIDRIRKGAKHTSGNIDTSDTRLLQYMLAMWSNPDI